MGSQKRKAENTLEGQGQIKVVNGFVLPLISSSGIYSHVLKSERVYFEGPFLLDKKWWNLFLM